jgi:anaerobic selenocysteine-containing dehydrogenase
MHKSVIGLAAAASLGLATLAAPNNANAACFGCAVGAGVLGGVVAGAIVGGAIANSPPPPPPGYYGYGPPPPPPPPGPYYGPPPAYAEGPPPCHWERRRVWVEEVQGYRIRPVQICP